MKKLFVIISILGLFISMNRLGQSEIDANFKIPNQPLYFYKPY